MIKNYDLLTTEEAGQMATTYPQLPRLLGEMQNEICRVTGVENDLPGPLLIAAISIAAGRGLMLSDRGRETGSNLYALITAPSGCGKSETYRHALKPLYTIHAERLAKHKSLNLPRIKAERIELEARRDRIKRELSKADLDEGDRDTRIRELTEIEIKLEELRLAEIAPSLIVEDCTSQTLPPMLEARGCVALASSDAGAVVQNLLGRYNGGASDADILLKAWSRESISVQRLGRELVDVEDACMSLALVGTPDLASELFNNKRLKAGGFLPRILFTASKSKATADDGRDRQLQSALLQKWEGTLRAVVRAFYGLSVARLVHPSSAASKRFVEAQNGLLEEINTGAAPAFAARIVEQGKRISLCLHAAEYNSEAPNIELSEATAAAGLAIAEFHYQQSLAMLSDSEFEADSKLYDRLKNRARQSKRFTVSQAKNSCGIDAEALAAKRSSWLSVTKTKTPGRPAMVIEFYR
jgi:hypothetical protein